ncbi:MAG: uncharacterized protein KVP18_004193 [Porospora cf. gigantea A]|nr:MAG: hypothetical protein KVP18_004193 [Porospora cf. gigantea A]
MLQSLEKVHGPSVFGLQVYFDKTHVVTGSSLVFASHLLPKVPGQEGLDGQRLSGGSCVRTLVSQSNYMHYALYDEFGWQRSQDLEGNMFSALFHQAATWADDPVYAHTRVAVTLTTGFSHYFDSTQPDGGPLSLDAINRKFAKHFGSYQEDFEGRRITFAEQAMVWEPKALYNGSLVDAKDVYQAHVVCENMDSLLAKYGLGRVALRTDFLEFANEVAGKLKGHGIDIDVVEREPISGRIHELHPRWERVCYPRPEDKNRPLLPHQVLPRPFVYVDPPVHTSHSVAQCESEYPDPVSTAFVDRLVKSQGIYLLLVSPQPLHSADSYIDVVGRHCPAKAIRHDMDEEQLDATYRACLHEFYDTFTSFWAEHGVPSVVVVLPTQKITAELYTSTIPQVVTDALEKIQKC